MSRNYEYKHFEHCAADDPFWLVIRRDLDVSTYEFYPEGDTTVVVGSSANAQVQVQGAAPIAFYLERLGNDLCLTPCYSGTDLRVDAQVVRNRTTISERAVVELGATRLELRIRDTPPTIPNEWAKDRTTDRSTALPDDTLHDAPVRLPLASDLLRTTTLEPWKHSNSGLCSVKTVELEAFDADGWFDATFPAAAKPERANSTTERGSSSATSAASRPGKLKRVTVPPRPRLVPKSPFDSMKTTEFSRSELLTAAGATKTVEIEPLAKSEAPTECKAARPRPRSPSELFRTLELGGVEQVAREPFRVTKPPTSKATGRTIESVTPKKRSRDTTEFEVLAVIPAPAPQLTEDEPAPRQGRVESYASAGSLAGGLQSHSPAAEIAQRASVQLSVPLEAGLSRLGLLTKTRPGLVVGTAAIGSIVLLLTFVGAANLAAERGRRTTKHYAVPSAQAAHLATPQADQKHTFGPSAAPSAVPVTPLPVDEMPAADAPVPDSTIALGHLFAGRLPEAEQAYRDLASRFPNEAAFRATSRILERRNSARCRAPNDAKTSCPAVKL